MLGQTLRQPSNLKAYLAMLRECAEAPYAPGWVRRAKWLLELGPRTVSKWIRASKRKAEGIYLTPSALAQTLVRPLWPHARRGERIGDPACGLGDLLLELLKALPRAGSLQARLIRAGAVLAGHDANPIFVEITRWRLALAIRLRGFRHQRLTKALVDESLSGITRRRLRPFDQLDASWRHVVMNPPFARSPLPRNCPWGSGLASRAAWFTTLAFASLRPKPGATVAALLPESLRSGFRYSKWRTAVSKNAHITSSPAAGQFADDADIHCFVLRGTVTTKLGRWRRPRRSSKAVLSDQAVLRVGAVVPHRDPQTGNVARALDARLLRSAQLTTAKPDDSCPTLQLSCLPSQARSSPPFMAPFVAIPRTSRPGESPRLRAVAVLGAGLVHVENHVIVVHPHGGNPQEFAAALRSAAVDRWVDKRIRMRHLPVGILKHLPLPRSSG